MAAQQGRLHSVVWAFAVACAAMTAHFADNWLRFDRYPLPSSLGAPDVLNSWIVLNVLGAAGLARFLRTSGRAGRVLLLLYASACQAGYLHYLYARPPDFTVLMNGLIVGESVAGLWLASSVARLGDLA